MKLITTVAPTDIPVTLDDARAQLSLLDDTSHDVRILRLIRAATAQAEAYTGMRALTQTVRLELDGFPSGEIDLQVYPVASITSVAYDDEAGSPQALVSGADFWPDLSGLFPRLLPLDGWPATRSGKPGCVRITMVVGHTGPDLVPMDFAQAVLLRMAELFDNTSESAPVQLFTVPVAWEALLAPHRRMVV